MPRASPLFRQLQQNKDFASISVTVDRADNANTVNTATTHAVLAGTFAVELAVGRFAS